MPLGAPVPGAPNYPPSEADIAAFVGKWYGEAMGVRVAEMLAADPTSKTGFVRSVRASLERQMADKQASG